VPSTWALVNAHLLVDERGTKNAVRSRVPHFSDHGIVTFLRHQDGPRLPSTSKVDQCHFIGFLHSGMHIVHMLVANLGRDSLHTRFQKSFQCESCVPILSISASLLVRQIWPSAPCRRVGNGLIASMSCSRHRNKRSLALRQQEIGVHFWRPARARTRESLLVSHTKNPPNAGTADQED
jgi:hypothetical protein